MSHAAVSRTQKHSDSGTVAVMGSCYALGTFTDNFYKQAAILLASAASLGSVQSFATVLFSLPYVLFSAWAGWFADKVAKKNLVVASKSLELLAMCFGGYMLLSLHWTGILIAICLMGVQATVFSPAINGSIPENFPREQVPRVNSLIKLASTAAILAGMACAGIFLDLRENSFGGILPALPASLVPDEESYGRAMAVLFIFAVSVAGWLTALALKKQPATRVHKRTPFPWTGPLDSIRHMAECRKDASLFLVLIADAWFYGIAAIAVISIANLVTGLGHSNTIAGAATALLMIGVAAGSLIAGRYQAESWQRLLIPAAIGMSLMLFLVGLAPLIPAEPVLYAVSPQLLWIFATLLLCGMCGGLYLIPLESYIQVRPAAAEKGKIIALSNFMSFVAMAVFGAAFQAICLLPPALTFVAYGAGTLIFVYCFVLKRLASLPGRSMQTASSGPLAWFMRAVLALRYRVRESGLDSLPAPARARNAKQPGVLFLPNHPALIDPVLVYSRLAGMSPRPLADARQMSGPMQRIAGRICHVVTIPDMEKTGRKGMEQVLQGLRAITETLRRGDNVLLYPSGRVCQNNTEILRGNSAAARIINAVPGARVVLVRTKGLWGSSFSHASGKIPNFVASFLRGVLIVIANLFFLTPRREVRMEFREPEDLPRDGNKLQLNRYLEAFYNEEKETDCRVRYFFWQKNVAGQGKPCIALPDRDLL